MENSSYQTYDFMKDVDYHIKTQTPIDLKDKSEIFKTYLFKLKLYQLNKRIKKNDPMFDELYCLVLKDTKAYVAKKIVNTTASIKLPKNMLSIILDDNPPKFQYVEILDAIKIIRKRKLNKIFPE